MGSAHGRKLAQYTLNEDAWDASHKHAGKVGDEESTPAIFVDLLSTSAFTSSHPPMFRPYLKWNQM